MAKSRLIEAGSSVKSSLPEEWQNSIFPNGFKWIDKLIKSEQTLVGLMSNPTNPPEEWED